jgi:hypothetical protein
VAEMTEVTPALIRRVEAAIADAGVSRSAVQHDWPDCHRKNCQYRHPDPDSAFTTMKLQIMRAVRDELQARSTTRPDVADDDDSPEQVAVYTLATLLHRYHVNSAGTFVKAAQLIVDAYPQIIPALADATQPPAREELNQ